LKRGKKPELPAGLLALFADPDLTFYGRNIDADFAKIGIDWGCSALLKKVRRVDLGRMASQRNVVARTNTSLENLVAVTLRKSLSKWGQVSVWSGKLTPAQVEYAAMDVTEPLKVFLHLSSLPDLSVRLEPEEALFGKQVFVVPSTGSVTNMSTRLAHGTIVYHTGNWAPDRADRPVKFSEHRRLVKLKTIYAPSGKVPVLKVPRSLLRLRPHPHLPKFQL
jgi:hypothetical protein